jgi:hypothetical protein
MTSSRRTVALGLYALLAIGCGQGVGQVEMEGGVRDDGRSAPVCRAKTSCPSMGFDCGSFVDDCGETADCGVCAAPLTCGVNVCQPPVCDEDGWCWEYPFPVGDDLHGVWAASEKDAWIVGDKGIVLHWDGARWASVPSGTTASLTDVWGSGPNDVWAVSTTSERSTVGESGSVIHWDGTAWTKSATPVGPNLFGGVSGTGPNDVWVAGAAVTRGFLGKGTSATPVILHFDGKTWTQTLTGSSGQGSFSSVHARTSDDAWAVGGTLAARWNGARWISAALPASLFVSSVSVRAQDDAFAVGLAGAIVHWDGVAWSSSSSPTSEDLTSVWTSLDGNVWISGKNQIRKEDGVFRWDGSRWQLVSLSPAASFDRVWGRTPDDVWAIGSFGEMRRWNGASWTRITRDLGARIEAVSGSSPNDVWAVGSGILHRDSTGWSKVPSPAQEPLHAVSASGPSNAWAVGTRPAHWNGAVWLSSMTSRVTTSGNGVWGSAANDVWMTSDWADDPGGILHWDGANMSQTLLPAGSTDPAAIGGTGPNDVRLVGYTIEKFQRKPWTLHWNGSDWSSDVGCPSDRAVWARKVGDVWFGGTYGVMHVDSSGCHAGSKPRVVDSVWGSGPNDVWMVANGGILRRHVP